jgi:tight adherence protein C
MSLVAALMTAAGIVLITRAGRSTRLSERVGRYLHPEPVSDPAGADQGELPPLAGAGLAWSSSDILLRRSATAACGGVVGALLAQGDLFVQGPGRSALSLIALGTAGGWLAFGVWVSGKRDRRSRLLRFELPIVTDALSLHVIAGESVATAIQAYVDESTGVASDELRAAMAEVASGRGIAEALQRSVRGTADPEAARLYTLLAHAHDTGGRLADALGDLGTDFRASLARDLTAEGGRRALTTYGPVLALMVPVTLLFLLFPTLTGLRSLAGGS